MERQQCPCCDYFTLEEYADWEICSVCFWEDDGHDLNRQDDPSSCNRGLTLHQGRENFRQFGACEPEMVQHVCSMDKRQHYRHASRTRE